MTNHTMYTLNLNTALSSKSPNLKFMLTSELNTLATQLKTMVASLDNVLQTPKMTLTEHVTIQTIQKEFNALIDTMQRIQTQMQNNMLPIVQGFDAYLDITQQIQTYAYKKPFEQTNPTVTLLKII